MKTETLGFINDQLSALGIPYEYMEWTQTLSYPYCVGEYIEEPITSEDSLHESEFKLTITGNTTWAELENIKNTVRSCFPEIGGKRVITSSGNAVAVFYSNGNSVPTGVPQLKRLEINLTVKEWGL